MEAVAAASSVAGLLSLSGQCISGAQNLLSLYKDIATASSTVENFMKDVNGLLRTLEDVRALLGRIEDHSPSLIDAVSLTSLKLQLEDCDQEIGSWLRTAQSTKPVTGKGTRAWFRKCWMVMDKQSTKNVRADMQKRRIEIAIALSTLGRAFDLKIALTTATVKDKVLQTHAMTNALLHSSTDANEAILRLEAVSMSISDEIGSMKSLLSACSSQSPTSGERSPSPRTLWTKGWQCDQWLLQDAVFGPVEDIEDDTRIRRCNFCGLSFLEPPALDVREHHLKITHKSAACVNKADLYLDWDLFLDHLMTMHNAIPGPWTWTLQDACSVQNTPSGPTNQGFSSALNEAEPHCTDEDPDAGLETWEDTQPQSTGEALVSGLWDSSLLGVWNSGRDRINRWMLHMLGAEPSNTDTHRNIYQENFKGSADIPSKMWSRLVLKYWFIDEAAIGYELNAAAVDLVSGELGFNSSLHLSARPSGTASVPDRSAKAHGTLVSTFHSRRMTEPSVPKRNASRAGSQRSSIGSIDQRLHETLSFDYTPIGLLEHDKESRHKAPSFKYGTISICALDSKTWHDPMNYLMGYLKRGVNRGDEFKVIHFGDRAILGKDVEKWPQCDFLISVSSHGFPLDKAIAYAKLRNPYCANDLEMQMVFHDRRLILRILSGLAVLLPERLEVNRDGGPRLPPNIAQRMLDWTGVSLPGSESILSMSRTVPNDVRLEDEGDTLIVDGRRLKKPFVEKPVSTEDSSIIIYYPKSKGGGIRSLSGRVDVQSKEEDDVAVPRCIIDRNASFIYEQLPVAPESDEAKRIQDVMVYAVGSEYCYTRTRDFAGWQETSTTLQEQRIVRVVSKAFGQAIHKLDLLRHDHGSYIVDIEGWKLPRHSDIFLGECARLLKKKFKDVSQGLIF